MKLIKLGERIPIGVSKRLEYPQEIMLKLPYFFWYGKHYDITQDETVKGFYIKLMLIKVYFGSAKFELNWRNK